MNQGTSTVSLTLAQALQQAIAHHQAGRLQEAEQLYRAILQAQPYQPDANHNLGVLAGQVGQHAAGLPHLKTALAINPSQGQYALSYADALLATGQAEAALDVIQAARQRGFNTPALLALRQKAEAARRSAPAQGGAPTPAQINQLIALFNAGHYAELESQARLLVGQYPDSGFVWKALGASLQMQGKDALPALQKATELLPADAEAHSNLGNALRGIGQFEGAVASYAQALAIKPDYAEALNNQGVALQDLGQLDGAVASYRRALAIKPDYAEAHSNLGNALKDLEQLEGALSSYRRALEIKPDFAKAYNNQGIALQDLGRLDGAVASFRRALEIEPGFAEAHSNLGNAQQDLGQLDDAVASFRRALEIEPDFAEAHNNLGKALQNLGKLDDAAEHFHRALEIKPDFAEAHSNLGNALHEIGQLHDAAASCRRALEINPDYAVAHNNLGIALNDLGQLDEAVASCRRALELAPDYAEAHNNLGNALRDLGQLDDALASYAHALEIKPDFAEAHSNLGNALKNLGQLAEAEGRYRRALQIKPDLAEAHFNLGLCLLEMGRHAEAWPEYESRWEGGKPKLSRPATLLPQWVGQPLPSGDRLLVIEEQGFGDKLQFARYLPLAAERFAGGVSLVCASPLQALFRRSFPGVEILDALPADQSAWQWQCPLLSLPLAFGTTLETIPQRVPYLVPDPVRAACWQTRIAELGLPPTTRKIGVVWKTGGAMKNAPMRVLSLQQLAPLLDLPGCAWFSLQKEADPDKAPWVASGKLIDWAGELADFDETAALAMNLDLIVSIDTAMAHLAGGLGLPTWLFNRHASEWRWMRDRDDSPWYPTLRIFTQEKAGEWDEVVERMAATLADMPDIIRNG